MTNESGSLQTFIMTPLQVQMKHPSLWHRSKSCDKNNNNSSSTCHRTYELEKLPEDEDFTKVKKGIIVTDYVDDSPRHMIESETSNN